MDAKPLQSITGTVEEIVYHNDDTGFTAVGRQTLVPE